MEERLGPGGFRNPSEWGKKAKIPSSTIHRIYETGRADPPTLAKLGLSVKVQPEEMFRLVGWLPEEEPAAVRLEDAADWDAILAAMPEGRLRRVLLEETKSLAQGLLRLADAGVIER